MLIRFMQTEKFKRLLLITIVIESILLVMLLYDTHKVHLPPNKGEIVLSGYTPDSNIALEQPTMRSKRLWCKSNSSCSILAEAGYYEARGEGDIGVVSVMHTILNRVNKEGRWPNTIKDVVYQNKQFSYTWDGSLKRGMNNTYQVDRMSVLAYDVLHGVIDSPVGSSDHYHTVYVNPSWSKHLNYTYHVGNHIFYEE